jgi:signal transduction histidine kinase
MLKDFIITHRSEIIENSRVRADRRTTLRSLTPLTGVPMFLNQLGDALLLPPATGFILQEEISRTARGHGYDLLRMGLTIAQVVHDYGDVCQAITELAAVEVSPITGVEFQILNLCLDDAIAGAVTEYNAHRMSSIEATCTERLGVLAHEMRNMLGSAIMAYETVKSGRVAIAGSVGTLLGRSLTNLNNLINRALTDVRLDAGIENQERIQVMDFLGEIEIAAVLQAQSKGLLLYIAPVPPAVAIEGDRQILVACIANLLHNAFKFTHKESKVSLTTRYTEDKVFFDVEDECGGLPPGKAEELFSPYSQRGDDRAGIGMGLAICLRAAKANGGDMHVRDIPGLGCVFTLELPRKGPPPLTIIEGGKDNPKILGVTNNGASPGDGRTKAFFRRVAGSSRMS